MDHEALGIWEVDACTVHDLHHLQHGHQDELMAEGGGCGGYAPREISVFGVGGGTWQPGESICSGAGLVNLLQVSWFLGPKHHFALQNQSMWSLHEAPGEMGCSGAVRGMLALHVSAAVRGCPTSRGHPGPPESRFHVLKTSYENFFDYLIQLQTENYKQDLYQRTFKKENAKAIQLLYHLK